MEHDEKLSNHGAPQEARCGRPKRQGEGNCKREAGWGTEHKGWGPCRQHGGALPNVVAASLARRDEALARELVTTYGLPIETTPEEALLDEVKRSAGHVAYLAERVRELDADTLVWGRAQRKESVKRVPSAVEVDPDGEIDPDAVPGWRTEVEIVTTETSTPNVWLTLYQKERAHLARVCADALRAGVEERRVRLAERYGALVAQLIRSILADLDLSTEQAARVPGIVSRHLHSVPAA
jgi:hypothetical protein